MCGNCANCTFKDNKQGTVPVPKSHPFHLSKVAKQSRKRSQLVSPENNTERGHGKQCLKGRGETTDDKIGSVRLSGEWLTQSVKFAYDMAYRGDWTPKEASGFLQSCNVRTSLAVNIVQKALTDSGTDKTPDCDELTPVVWNMSPDFLGIVTNSPKCRCM